MKDQHKKTVKEIMNQFENSFNERGDFDIWDFSLSSSSENIKYEDEDLQSLFIEFARGWLTCHESIKKQLFVVPSDYMNDIPNINDIT